MAAPRDLATLQLVDSKRFKTTYAQLMVSFMLDYFDATKAQFNPAIADIAIDYVSIGQLDARLTSLSSSSASIRANTQDVLDKLNAAFQQPVKSNTYDISLRKNDYDILMRRADPALETSKNLDKVEDSLRKNYMDEREQIMASLRNLAKAIANASNPDVKAHSQEIENELSKIGTRCQTLKTSLRKLEESRTASNEALKDIHKKGFLLLPATDKQKVVPPLGETPTLSGPPAA